MKARKPRTPTKSMRDRNIRLLFKGMEQIIKESLNH